MRIADAAGIRFVVNRVLHGLKQLLTDDWWDAAGDPGVSIDIYACITLIGQQPVKAGLVPSLSGFGSQASAVQIRNDL